jgi:hypothetical protein
LSEGVEYSDGVGGLNPSYDVVRGGGKSWGEKGERDVLVNDIIYLPMMDGIACRRKRRI